MHSKANCGFPAALYKIRVSEGRQFMMLHFAHFILYAQEYGVRTFKTFTQSDERMQARSEYSVFWIFF